MKAESLYLTYSCVYGIFLSIFQYFSLLFGTIILSISRKPTFLDGNPEVAFFSTTASDGAIEGNETVTICHTLKCYRFICFE